MDKDMERLGKERLKRVRRRRQLATFIISMAVIVLGITAVSYTHLDVYKRQQQQRVQIQGG